MSTFNFTNNEERTNNNTTTKLICDFGGEHGDKVGFKNENGELVIPHKYDDAMQYEVENEKKIIVACNMHNDGDARFCNCGVCCCG